MKEKKGVLSGLAAFLPQTKSLRVPLLRALQRSGWLHSYSLGTGDLGRQVFLVGSRPVPTHYFTLNKFSLWGGCATVSKIVILVYG
jgi:hypothetical protein